MLTVLQKTEARKPNPANSPVQSPKPRDFPPTNLAPEAINGVGIRFTPSLAPKGVLFSVLDQLEGRQERKVRCSRQTRGKQEKC